MLAEALWTTFPEMFTCSCAKLSQENLDNKEKDFFLCNVVWNLKDNIA